MTDQNAYDKFLQNYAMYGMPADQGAAAAAPGAGAAYYEDYSASGYGAGDFGNSNQDQSSQGGYNKPQHDGSDNNNRGNFRGGNQQRGGYQQRNNYNNNSNNNSNSGGGGGYHGGFQNRNRDFNQGGGNGEIIIQKDTIFIQNLPKDVTATDLEKNFGSIGVIKIDKRTGQSKIWIYKDKNTGEGKGEATVTYDDDQAAKAAIDWFNNKEIMGNVVKIQLATRKNNFNNFNNRGGGRGGGFGGGGGGNFGDRGQGGGRGGGGNRFNNNRNNDGGNRGFGGGDRGGNDRGFNQGGRGGGGGGGGGYNNQGGRGGFNRGGGGGQDRGYSRPTPY